MSVSSRGSPTVTVMADHRNGICNACGIPMEKETVVVRGEDGFIMQCNKCGGRTGQLIARSVSIQPPAAPTCFRFCCLWNFYLKVVFHWLLSSYHMKRVVYAEKNRRKTIPVKYRSGEDSPKTIKGAIWGIIKLSLRSSTRR